MLKQTVGIFSEALKEVRSSILKVVFFEEALNAILVFLGAYLLTSIFKLGLLPAVGVAVAYSAFAIYRELHVKPTKAVESKYKDLKEKLSTAAEYATVENRVVNELKSEVLQNLRKVEESSFLNERKVYFKAIAAVVLCFLILLTTPISISFLKLSLPDIFPDRSSETLEGSFRLVKENPRDAPIAIVKSKKDIYGAPTVTRLGDEELTVILRPAGSELGSSNPKQPEELQFAEYYPEEVVSVAAESSEERIPREQQELVRRYFKNVVESQQ